MQAVGLRASNASTEALQAAAKALPSQAAMAARNTAEYGANGFVQTPGLQHQAVLSQWQMANSNDIQRAQKAIQANLESQDRVAAAKRRVNIDIQRRKLANDPAALAGFESALSGGSVTNAGLENFAKYAPNLYSQAAHNWSPSMTTEMRIRKLLGLPIDAWAPR